MKGTGLYLIRRITFSSITFTMPDLSKRWDGLHWIRASFFYQADYPEPPTLKRENRGLFKSGTTVDA